MLGMTVPAEKVWIQYTRYDEITAINRGTNERNSPASDR